LRARRAFTLVEVLIAIILLAVGVLALSSTAVAVSRQTTLGVRQNLAAKVAQSRFEWMRTRTCAQLHDSATTTRGIAEGWVVIAGHNATAQATVTVRIPGRRTTESFTTALAC
jgi:prepilin-type N-terminal cleavage/methylation domain-containing protein